jgi:hypothetical protein
MLQVAVWSASEGNGADPSIVAISRYSRSILASAGKRPVSRTALSDPSRRTIERRAWNRPPRRPAICRMDRREAR